MSVRTAAILIIAALAVQPLLSAQAQPRPPAPAPARRAPAPAPLRTEAPMLNCPAVLGQGAKSARMYCDVLIERDPAAGITIPFPPHTGDVTLTFTLHNRHTYSEDEIKNKRAFHRYKASVGVMEMDTTLFTGAVVQNEVRSPADRVQLIYGGSGLGGLNAVSPTGS